MIYDNCKVIYEILSKNLIYKMYKLSIIYIYVYIKYIEKIDINNI
jgi:hypothetical protein